MVDAKEQEWDAGLVGNSQVQFSSTHPESPIPNPGGDRLGEHRQNVVLAHDLVCDAFELVRAARVLAVDYLVADLDLWRAQLAVVQSLAFTDGDHFTLGRLFLGVVGHADSSEERRVGKESAIPGKSRGV